jgi:hypothetical protein
VPLCGRRQVGGWMTPACPDVRRAGRDPSGADHAHSTSLRAMVSEHSESNHAHV